MATGNNVSLPEPLLSKIQGAARAEHRSVEDVLADAVKRYLDDRSWTSLLAYGQERAAELGINESGIDRLIAESRAERGR
jgi:metal-responsive CopG/Arc/MetJ family transcriptional regulator